MLLPRMAKLFCTWSFIDDATFRLSKDYLEQNKTYSPYYKINSL